MPRVNEAAVRPGWKRISFSSILIANDFTRLIKEDIFLPINVRSEIGSLKRVLLHRPGQELEYLTPSNLKRLLFDDIPYLAAAQHEHDVFANTLRQQGAEVVYLEDLMAQTLKISRQIREDFIEDFINASGPTGMRYHDDIKAYLDNFRDEKKLVEMTMAGVPLSALNLNENTLAAMVSGADHFALDPLPNLYFTRDTFASIGSGVSLNHMYSAARQRETIYGRYILKYHPDYAGKVPLYYTPENPFSIEGGDILVLNEQVLAIGLSQRTSPEGIELLADHLFSDPDCSINCVLVMDIPALRAFMHLDTVFTQLDTDKFVIHPEIRQSLRLFELVPKDGRIRTRQVRKPLEAVLRETLKLDSINIIDCGGDDQIASEREQWNDGSNTLCVRPGVVIAYDRNRITNRILRSNGIRVLEVPSSELARGRGGPRCMSMPLLRE